jgi:glycine hydroxymethyltransferase
MRNPFDFGFDIVTTTVHKSLRGPRAGMVLCRKKFAKEIDKSVFPGLQGGPHMNTIAGIAITLGKALQPEFREYGAKMLSNAKALAGTLTELGGKLVTGGTDNHMLVLDTVASFGIDGRVAEETLDRVSITTNKQITPDDPNPPLRPSGIRMGSPAATTRGMDENDMRRLAGWIHEALAKREDDEAIAKLREQVESFCRRFPVPGL